MSDTTKLTKFMLDDKTLPVRFIDTQAVKEGVTCDIYTFTGDNSKDLAIVRVAQGYRTPLQRVLHGDKTIEGLHDGTGTLTVRSENGRTDIYSFDSSDSEAIVINVGQIMQWHASGNSDLVFYEVCEPSYREGRFENLI